MYIVYLLRELYILYTELFVNFVMYWIFALNLIFALSVYLALGIYCKCEKRI